MGQCVSAPARSSVRSKKRQINSKHPRRLDKNDCENIKENDDESVQAKLQEDKLFEDQSALQAGCRLFRSFVAQLDPDVDSRRKLLHETLAHIDHEEQATPPDRRDASKCVWASYRALAFFHLAVDVETRPSTRTECFHRSACYFSETFSSTAQHAKGLEEVMEAVMELGSAFVVFAEKQPRYASSLESLILTLAGRGKAADNELFRAYLAELWLQLGRLRLQESSMQIIKEDYRAALAFVRDTYRPVEEAKKHARGSIFQEQIEKEADILELEYCNQLSIAEAFQACHIGQEYLLKVLDNPSSKGSEQIGWRILDKFHEANTLSRGLDVDVLCLGLLGIGKTYLKLFKNKHIAKCYFKEVLDLAGTLMMDNPYTRKWYVEVVAITEKIRMAEIAVEEAKWENARKPFLEELKAELEELELYSNKSLAELYAVLKEKHPSKHKEPEEGNTTVMPDFEVDKSLRKKFLIKVMALYHPDKIDKEKFGLKYVVLCEEIYKALSQRYNGIKTGIEANRWPLGERKKGLMF